jgi:hypothetical protein
VWNRQTFVPAKSPDQTSPNADRITNGRATVLIVSTTVFVAGSMRLIVPL